MSVYRYINNSSKDIVSGAYLVPAYDQLIFNESQPVLDALVGKSLVGVINGMVVEDIINEPEEIITESEEVTNASEEVITANAVEKPGKKEIAKSE